ncbi:MAG: hypothetical protein K8W52_02280 [Deltaproteobacteria bacterium]|nr:hypothetical protein [Deltaproteobacteria bacterium]
MRLFDGADAISIAPLDDDSIEEASLSEAQQAIPAWLNAGYYAPLRHRMIERHAAPAVGWLRDQLRPGGNRERDLAQQMLALVTASAEPRAVAAELAELRVGMRIVDALRELELLGGLDPATLAPPPSPELPPMATAPLGARDLVQALQRAGWMSPRGDRPGR